jgi:hypothetical protein
VIDSIKVLLQIQVSYPTTALRIHLLAYARRIYVKTFRAGIGL